MILVGSFDAERLANILVRAQGERTRQRYAMDAGISLTYLSNLIKGRTVGPPSPSTLRKLAASSGGATSFQELMDACGHQEGDEAVVAVTARERENYTRIIHQALERLPVEPDGDTIPPRVADALRRQLARHLEPLEGRPASYSSRAALADFLFRVDDPTQLRRLSRLFESVNVAPQQKTSIARLLQYAMDSGYTSEDMQVVANLLDEIRRRDRERGPE